MGRDPEVLTVYSTATRQEVTRIEHAAEHDFGSLQRRRAVIYVDRRRRSSEYVCSTSSTTSRSRPSRCETEVHSVRFTPDDRYIVAVGTDESLRAAFRYRQLALEARRSAGGDDGTRRAANEVVTSGVDSWRGAPAACRPALVVP